MSAMLDSSSYLYFLSSDKRKTTLAHFMVDHGIWQDINAWKQCIELNIKTKMHESAERLKRRE